MSTITLGADVDVSSKKLKVSAFNRNAAWTDLSGSYAETADSDGNFALTAALTKLKSYAAAVGPAADLSTCALLNDATQEILADQIKLDDKLEAPLILPHTTNNGIVIGDSGSGTGNACRIEVKTSTVKVIGRNNADNADVELLTITMNE